MGLRLALQPQGQSRRYFGKNGLTSAFTLVGGGEASWLFLAGPLSSAGGEQGAELWGGVGWS